MVVLGRLPMMLATEIAVIAFCVVSTAVLIEDAFNRWRR